MVPLKINHIYHGEALDVLKTFPDNVINCCVTSPPYWGLRDYERHPDQLGLEKTPEEFIDRCVGIFGEVYRVLKKDATLWINIGDSYAASGKGGNASFHGGRDLTAFISKKNQRRSPPVGYKRKDIVGVPFMLAFALRDFGWYWRDIIIWHKPAPQPESVKDRCTKSHEYILMFSRSEKYYYDHEAIKTDASPNTNARVSKDVMSGKVPSGWDSSVGDGGHGSYHKKGRNKKIAAPGSGIRNNSSFQQATMMNIVKKVNKRSVWTIPVEPSNIDHFATFPQKLVTDCIKAGCPEGGLILDPFAGRNTTGVVARKLHRNFVAIELVDKYIKFADKFSNDELGVFN